MNPQAEAILYAFSPIAYGQAVEMERLVGYGLALELTRDEVGEVVDAWQAWYRQMPFCFDFDVVRDSVTRRALGERWTPPTAEEIAATQRRLDVQ